MTNNIVQNLVLENRKVKCFWGVRCFGVLMTKSFIIETELGFTNHTKGKTLTN